MNSRLKGSFVALGALLSLSSAAIAADQSIPVYKAAPVVVQGPAFSWTGCYIGGHAGGGWYKSSFIESGNDNGGIGWVGGAQAGCNYQVRQFVFGLEGEYWWSGLKDESQTIETGSSFSSTARNRNDWDIAVRMGVTFDRALFYGKLGIASGRFDYNTSESPGFSEAGSARINGLLAGVGLEYAVTDQWSAKIEYDYIQREADRQGRLELPVRPRRQLLHSGRPLLIGAPRGVDNCCTPVAVRY
jgi:outer membrane immunogenic protein